MCARPEFFPIIAIAVNLALAAADIDVHAFKCVEVCLQSFHVRLLREEFITRFLVDEGLLDAFFGCGSRLRLFFQHGGADGGVDGAVGEEGVAAVLELGAFKVFDLPERHEEFGLQAFGDGRIRIVRILEVQPELEVGVELPIVVEIGEVPYPCKGWEVFECGDHAVAVWWWLAPLCQIGGVNQDSQVKILEVRGRSPGGDDGNFALAVDVGYCLGPWGGDLDKDVVVEDLGGFMMDEAIDTED